MFCTRCGAANPDTSAFCVSCGGPLQNQGVISPPAPMAYGSPQGNPVPTETSGKAIASLICGLLFFIFPAAVAAIILGHLSLSDINKSAGRLAGRGLAITGLVFGYGGVAFIPFVLIIAAIAIPNLLHARMAANEASAVGSLRTIETASITYSATYGNGFPPSLQAMGGGDSGPASCDHAQLIEPALAAGRKYGYVFSYIADPADPPKAPADGCTRVGGASFEMHADPTTRGTTGQRSFFADESGVIRYEGDGPAGTESSPLGQ
jgi:type IV pilus assembly protein PilA